MSSKWHTAFSLLFSLSRYLREFFSFTSIFLENNECWKDWGLRSLLVFECWQTAMPAIVIYRPCSEIWPLITSSDSIFYEYMFIDTIKAWPCLVILRGAIIHTDKFSTENASQFCRAKEKHHMNFRKLQIFVTIKYFITREVMNVFPRYF